jgi:hypothetical protein
MPAPPYRCAPLVSRYSALQRRKPTFTGFLSSSPANMLPRGERKPGVACRYAENGYYMPRPLLGLWPSCSIIATSEASDIDNPRACATVCKYKCRWPPQIHLQRLTRDAVPKSAAVAQTVCRTLCVAASSVKECAPGWLVGHGAARQEQQRHTGHLLLVPRLHTIGGAALVDRHLYKRHPPCVSANAEQ